MQLRHALIGTAALGAAAAAVSAVLLLHPFSLRHGSKVTSGQAQLHVYGGRSAQQRLDPHAAKLDGALADLTRHLGKVRPDHAIEDLRSLSPAARFSQHSAAESPRIAVDATTRGDPQALKAALVALGLKARRCIKTASAAGCRSIGSRRPPRAPKFSRCAPPCRARTRRWRPQGDFVQRSNDRAQQLSELDRLRRDGRRAVRQLQLL